MTLLTTKIRAYHASNSMIRFMGKAKLPNDKRINETTLGGCLVASGESYKIQAAITSNLDLGPSANMGGRFATSEEPLVLDGDAYSAYVERDKKHFGGFEASMGAQSEPGDAPTSKFVTLFPSGRTHQTHVVLNYSGFEDWNDVFIASCQWDTQRIYLLLGNSGESLGYADIASTTVLTSVESVQLIGMNAVNVYLLLGGSISGGDKRGQIVKVSWSRLGFGSIEAESPALSWLWTSSPPYYLPTLVRPVGIYGGKVWMRVTEGSLSGQVIGYDIGDFGSTAKYIWNPLGYGLLIYDDITIDPSGYLYGITESPDYKEVFRIQKIDAERTVVWSQTYTFGYYYVDWPRRFVRYVSHESGDVILVASGMDILVVDADTGAERYRLATDGVSGIAIYNKKIYVSGGSTTKLRVFDLASGYEWENVDKMAPELFWDNYLTHVNPEGLAEGVVERYQRYKIGEITLHDISRVQFAEPNTTIRVTSITSDTDGGGCTQGKVKVIFTLTINRAVGGVKIGYTLSGLANGSSTATTNAMGVATVATECVMGVGKVTLAITSITSPTGWTSAFHLSEAYLCSQSLDLCSIYEATLATPSLYWATRSGVWFIYLRAVSWPCGPLEYNWDCIDNPQLSSGWRPWSGGAYPLYLVKKGWEQYQWRFACRDGYGRVSAWSDTVLI